MINYNIVTYTKAAVYSIFLPFSQNWSNIMLILVFCVVFRYDNVTLSPLLFQRGAKADWGLRYRIYVVLWQLLFVFFLLVIAFPVLLITSSAYPFGIFKLIFHYYVCFIRLWGQILWLSDIKRYNCAEWTYDW